MADTANDLPMRSTQPHEEEQDQRVSVRPSTPRLATLLAVGVAVLVVGAITACVLLLVFLLKPPNYGNYTEPVDPPGTTGYPPSTTGYTASTTGYTASTTGYTASTTEYTASTTGYTATTESTRTAPPSTTPLSTPTPLEPSQRIDCLFDSLSNKTLQGNPRLHCESRGCVYHQLSDTSGMNAPHCYYPEVSDTLGYQVTGEPSVGSDGTVEYILKSKGSSLFGGDLPRLRLVLTQLTDATLRIRILNAEADRYEVPVALTTPDVPTERPRYDVNVTFDPFSFSVTRRSTGQVIFRSFPTAFAYADQLIQVATDLPTNKLMGLGETVKPRFLLPTDRFRTWALFARDQPVFEEHQNFYGVHPVYAAMEPDHSAHGVFFLNSNAMEFVTTPGPKLVHRTTGGVLDLFFFLGPDPESVAQQYHQLIGKPVLPPYWSLGFHISRYGFRSLRQLNETVQRNRDIQLPLDVVHLDIDHMDNRMVFTVDPVNYPDLYNYLKTQRRLYHTRNIVITNPVIITNASDYAPYELGKQLDVFVRWPSRQAMPPGDFELLNDTLVLGYVWPRGLVAFVDFFKNSSVPYWTELIGKMYNSSVPFDGIWIDMNEPANFGTNEEKPWNWPEDAKPYWSLKCNNQSLLEMPPYRPAAAYYWDSGDKVTQLSDKTICMDVTHSLASDAGRQARHYDVHSLYGHASEMATAAALREISKAEGRRLLIIGRSNFPGSGARGGTWLGDNDSSEKHMRASTFGMFDFNLFGIPYVGADICGFFNDATPELCTLWMQVGAFYPFSRNHNFEGSADQDPAAYLSRCPTCVDKMVWAVRQRYRLNPYFYTQFHRVHRHGGTVVRPLFFNFPLEESLHNEDSAFMWGEAVMISPQMALGASNLTYWLPPGVWYDITDSQSVRLGELSPDSDSWGFRNSWRVDRATQAVVDSSVNLPLIHLRGGYSIFTAAPALSTHDQIASGSFQLVVAINADQVSQGELIWDDGEAEYSHLPINEQPIFHLAVSCAKGRCVLNPIRDGVPQLPKVLESVTILEMRDNWPDELLINGRSVEFRSASINGGGVAIVTNLTEAVNLTHRVEIEWRSGRTWDLLDRVDCAPENWSIDAVACSSRGCQADTESRDRLSDWVPRCFFDPGSRANSYAVVNSTSGQDGSVLYSVDKIDNRTLYSSPAQSLTIGVYRLTTGALRIKVTDSESDRYEVPIPINSAQSAASQELEAVVDNDLNGRLHLLVRRGSGSRAELFNTAGGFVFENQFLQLPAALPTQFVFGLGEHTHPNLKHRFDYSTWPMFSRDQPVGGHHGNFYGVHPLLIGRDVNGDAFGIFFFNSNGQEVQFVPSTTIVYRTIGGILDVFFFPGPSVSEVVSQYTSLVGRPRLPPVWALGFHLCRYGYNDGDTLNQTVRRNMAAGVPIDVQYADIDHFERNKIFTYDKEKFSNLPQLIQELKSQRIKFIYILDPPVVTNETSGSYHPYEAGAAVDAFVKWPTGESPDQSISGNDNMLGYVWPFGPVVFPDFFADRVQDYWVQQIKDYSQTLQFDGLWLDMNEPANFGTNEERPWNWPEDAKPYWSLKCNLSNPLETPPYKTKMWGQWISDKTICMAAQHSDGKYRHYDVHSLYGKMQAIATDRAVQNVTGRRGLVITRATFPGDGQFGGTWLGDNGKTWGHMRDSIVGMIEHGLFGIPFVGADICGYFGDAVDRDLCIRWSQLGAWYPYSRNHNGLQGRPQDPAAFDSRATAAIRESLADRYRLLPYLYTQMYAAQLRGEPPVRPLFQDFPSDPVAWDVETQFMWGPALMIVPNIMPNTVTTTGYLPFGVTWFDYYTGVRISEGGDLHRFSTPEDRVAIAVASGSVVFAYEGFDDLFARPVFFNTASLRNRGLQLLIAASRAGRANGELFVDDGESIDPGKNGAMVMTNLTVASQSSSLRFLWNTNFVGDAFVKPEIESAIVFGLADAWKSLTVSGNCRRVSSLNPRFQCDTAIGICRIRGIALTLEIEQIGACTVTFT